MTLKMKDMRSDVYFCGVKQVSNGKGARHTLTKQLGKRFFPGSEDKNVFTSNTNNST